MNTANPGTPSLLSLLCADPSWTCVSRVCAPHTRFMEFEAEEDVEQNIAQWMNGMQELPPPAPPIAVPQEPPCPQLGQQPGTEPVLQLKATGLGRTRGPRPVRGKGETLLFPGPPNPELRRSSSLAFSTLPPPASL